MKSRIRKLFENGSPLNYNNILNDNLKYVNSVEDSHIAYSDNDTLYFVNNSGYDDNFKTAYNKAMELIDIYHGEQLYDKKLKLPYKYHLSMAVNTLIEYINVTNDIILFNDYTILDLHRIIIALLLHDIVEDTNINIKTLKCIFHEKIVDAVLAVTDSKNLNTRQEKKSEVYHRINQNGKYAILVKLIDRLSNMAYTAATENRNKKKMYELELIEFLFEITGYTAIKNILYNLNIKDIDINTYTIHMPLLVITIVYDIIKNSSPYTKLMDMRNSMTDDDSRTNAHFLLREINHFIKNLYAAKYIILD